MACRRPERGSLGCPRPAQAQQEICAQADAATVEEAEDRTEDDRDRQAAILRGSLPGSWTDGTPSSWSLEEQSNRRVARLRSSQRTQDAGIQIARISAEIPVASRCDVQRLQRPAASDQCCGVPKPSRACVRSVAGSGKHRGVVSVRRTGQSPAPTTFVTKPSSRSAFRRVHPRLRHRPRAAASPWTLPESCNVLKCFGHGVRQSGFSRIEMRTCGRVWAWPRRTTSLQAAHGRG
jgi:hypothetical protein